MPESNGLTRCVACSCQPLYAGPQELVLKHGFFGNPLEGNVELLKIIYTVGVHFAIFYKLPVFKSLVTFHWIGWFVGTLITDRYQQLIWFYNPSRGRKKIEITRFFLALITFSVEMHGSMR